VPYVVETSVGLDRMFLSVLSNSYREEKLEDGSERVVLRIPAPLAPNKVGILPLTKNDGLPEKAEAVMNELKYDLRCFYEEKDAIGKRYRRQDAIGTPYCVTIDHQTLQDDTVTIRDRDSMKQERLKIADVRNKLVDACSVNNLLRKI
jgi:glycyl-tRNA synthetase